MMEYQLPHEDHPDYNLFKAMNGAIREANELREQHSDGYNAAAFKFINELRDLAPDDSEYLECIWIIREIEHFLEKILRKLANDQNMQQCMALETKILEAVQSTIQARIGFIQHFQSRMGEHMDSIEKEKG